MAARGPLPSVSAPSYRKGGGSSETFRGNRGRNRSSGSSGASSRDHSVEGRSERRGSGDFRAAYHGQYRGQSKKDLQHLPSEGLEAKAGFVSVAKGKKGGQKWGLDSEGGGNRDQHWRSSQGGVHGRVQGVFPDAEAPRGYALAIGGQARGYGAPHQRQENGYGGLQRQENGYGESYQRQGNAHGGYQRQENVYGGYQRQENAYGGHQRQENNAYGGRQRRDAVYGGGGHHQKQENTFGGNGRQENNGFGTQDGRGSYGKASQGGSSRGRGALDAHVGVERVASSLGRDLRASQETVFGDGRELETFGSPKSLSRTMKAGSFLSPKEDLKFQHVRDEDTRSGLDDRGNSFRSSRSFSNETMGQGEGRSGKGNYRDKVPIQNRRGSFEMNQEYHDDRQKMGGQAGLRRTIFAQSISGRDEREKLQAPVLKPRDEEFAIPSSSSLKGSFSKVNSFERERDESGGMPILSPGSSSTGSFSRTCSVNRKKKGEDSTQLPIFSPKSPTNVDVKRQSSFDGLSRESSLSVSLRDTGIEGDERSSLSGSDKTPGLEGDERWSATKQPPSKVRESASAGMHRTRSTDWYEICLKEEEEELEALAHQQEEESALGRQDPGLMHDRIFSRTISLDRKGGKSLTFGTSSAKGDVKRETNNLERRWLHERSVREDPADGAQPNFPSPHGNADLGGRQGLFTPWNSLRQTGPNANPGPRSAPRGKSLVQELEKVSGESKDEVMTRENIRVSLVGGRQTGGWGRRTVNAIRSEEVENWRPGRRPRDFPEEGSRAQVSVEKSAESQSGGAVPRGTNEHENIIGSSVQVANRDHEVFTKEEIVSKRPTAFYRALHESVAGDEEPLPHISFASIQRVGTESVSAINMSSVVAARERLQRERLRDLAVFERVSGDMRTTSKEIAVKKFCRTVVASELEQSDVRPLPVLWRTLQYLLGLLDDPEFSFNIVHNFLFDRTRAIRQELGMQRIFDHQTITMHEEIVRFHIVSEHELREQNRKRSKQFDTHLNLQQLSKSLHSLLNLYISLGGDDGTSFENEAEFHAYHVLLNLGNHGQFQAEPLSLWFPSVPSNVLKGPPMQLARKALRLYRNRNFVGFFRLVKEATYLQCCLLELNFDSIRAIALAMLNVAEYKLHPFPLSDLAHQLMLDEDEVEEVCKYYGLLTGLDNSSQKHCLLAKQAQFVMPEKDSLPQYSCPLIDSKRAPSYRLEVKGSASTYTKVSS